MGEFTLLYVEDDLEILENVMFLFTKYFKKIYTAGDGEEGLAQYYKHKPDIIVTDINMPKLDGIELIKIIREDDIEIPIIIITAYSDREKLLKAIEIGVSSYVIKPFTRDSLKEAILKVIAQKTLQNKAIQDSLTSLYNRNMLTQVMQNSIDTAKRHDTYLTYIMLDIDYFKEYNDTYGHLAGDKALKSVALSLKTHINRVDDYAFRVGGEEFTLVFLSLDIEKSLVYADRIREDILALKIEHSKNSVNQFLSISLGVYVAKGEDILNQEQIYSLSDKALYNSKNNGRNMVSLSKDDAK